MPSTFKSPGVYWKDLFLRPDAKLPTGIPGFVGFAIPKDNTLPPSPVTLHRKEEFPALFESVPESHLTEVINGFFDNGGLRCYLSAADPAGDREQGLMKGIDRLSPLNDLDLVAAPDAVTLRKPDRSLDREAVLRVQRGLLEHCKKEGDRFALLDPLPESTPEAVLAQRGDLMINQEEPVNGALYYPWVRTADLLVPPSGHVAGIVARTDAKAGVFKAPANEELLGVIDLEIQINNALQDQLNPEGVNCLRPFPGRGIRLWGARTLSRDPNWRYVNVRRLFLTLGRWIDANMRWATFEPNDPRLWVRIQRELGVYLAGLRRAGALKGATAEEAFYIKCDAETNPPAQRESGEVVTEIGLAPLSPAEFVVVRIIHRVGSVETR